MRQMQLAEPRVNAPGFPHRFASYLLILNVWRTPIRVESYLIS